MTEAAAPKRAKSVPIFELDLGENGGWLAPTDLTELHRWLDAELQFWQWLPRRNFGPHSSAAAEAHAYLVQASNYVDNARNNLANQTKEWVASQIESAKAQISTAFITRRLPHSSTTLAKRIQAFLQESGEEATSYYLIPFLGGLNQMQSQSYSPNTVAGWHGAVAGQIDRHNLVQSSKNGRRDAADKALEELRLRATTLVDVKGLAIEELHRSYETLEQDANALLAKQDEAFREEQSGRDSAFDTLKGDHAKAMESIRQTFIDGMAMRAPAAYWAEKQAQHARGVQRFTWLTFVGIAVALSALGLSVWIMLKSLPTDKSHPPAWQLGVLALGSLLVIWALRLIVRMYLSHVHLERDADERIVMVQTYLALLEAKALDSNEHRQLILNALFRPAADGIVKDEALPFSVAEVLTRTGKP